MGILLYFSVVKFTFFIYRAILKAKIQCFPMSLIYIYVFRAIFMFPIETNKIIEKILYIHYIRVGNIYLQYI